MVFMLTRKSYIAFGLSNFFGWRERYKTIEPWLIYYLMYKKAILSNISKNQTAAVLHTYI